MAYLQNTPRVTKNLIYVNILVFIATLINEGFIVGNFALFYPTSDYFHFWQPVTHLFVHGSFWHIFFNMYALWLFGSIVEQVIGEKKFLLLYFVCGLGAAGLYLFVEFLQGGTNVPCVGASGAIYGLLIAYAMLFPTNRLTLIFPPITLNAKTWVIIFIAIELLTGWASARGFSDGVAHSAHLGGALLGFLMITYWRRRGTLFDREYFEN